ncbi:MAG: hypothetical protein J6S47_06930 [Eubacteriaceae bacterium]|nr:hypothetical protein [Eubacteriaceae bacterium]
MNKITKHPLRITADALLGAFALNGFDMYDNGEFPELELSEVNVRIFDDPSAVTVPVLLQDGEYSLRTQLLPFALTKMRENGSLKAVAAGKVFDGSDEKYPAHLKLEGIVTGDMDLYDVRVLWTKIARSAFGAGCGADLEAVSDAAVRNDLANWGASAMKDSTMTETVSFRIKVSCPDGSSFTLGHTGTMTWMGRALLGTKAPLAMAFSIDIDEISAVRFGLNDRKELFDNSQKFLSRFEDPSAGISGSFEDLCRDYLRAMGYSEGFGPKIYPDGIYKKMNMIQESWDLNNVGVLLKEPLGTGTGLPTVLTPAIEQIISEKWAAGEKSAKAFEISHIFIPQKGGSPVEKLALSFAAYGDDVDQASFTKEVGDFLTKIGNNNHFFIPNTQAIAYKFGECRLLLDEKMSYLGGNFGGMSEKAEANFGIGTHAYMANLELKPLKDKAAEEYGYIAPELR